MILCILVATFLMLGSVGITLAFAAGSSSNLLGWMPNPLGCLMFAIAVAGVGGVALFCLGMRVAQ